MPCLAMLTFVGANITSCAPRDWTTLEQRHDGICHRKVQLQLASLTCMIPSRDSFANYVQKACTSMKSASAHMTSSTTACGLQFRDEYSVFTQAGAEVVGVSNDQPEALVEFVKSQRLKFPLLSDEGGKLRKGLKVKGAADATLSKQIADACK